MLKRLRGIWLIAVIGATGLAVALWMVFSPSVVATRAGPALLFLVTLVYAMAAFLSWSEARKSSEVVAANLKYNTTAYLSFRTVVDDSPTLENLVCASVLIEPSRDLDRAKADYAASPNDKEFVFVGVKNTGKETAYDMRLNASYRISEMGGNPKAISVQHTWGELPAGVERFVFVHCFSSVVTQDSIEFTSATLDHTDPYQRISEKGPTRKTIEPGHGGFNPLFKCKVGYS
jgi:hypothetical protein